MNILRLALAGCAIFLGSAAAQQPGPALSVDAQAGRHAISPDVYGINFYWDVAAGNSVGQTAALGLRPTARRWGGNNNSTYHWQYDVSNIDADWFFEVLPDTTVNESKLPDGSTFNKFADQGIVTGGRLV